jgi:hypothetical protein
MKAQSFWECQDEKLVDKYKMQFSIWGHIGFFASSLHAEVGVLLVDSL